MLRSISIIDRFAVSFAVDLDIGSLGGDRWRAPGFLPTSSSRPEGKAIYALEITQYAKGHARHRNAPGIQGFGNACGPVFAADKIGRVAAALEHLRGRNELGRPKTLPAQSKRGDRGAAKTRHFHVDTGVDGAGANFGL